jgi:hypothetical protein
MLLAASAGTVGENSVWLLSRADSDGTVGVIYLLEGVVEDFVRHCESPGHFRDESPLHAHSTTLAFVDVISPFGASSEHLGRAPPLSLELMCLCEPPLLRRFGPSTSDVGVPMLFVVVVAWPVLVTDVALGSTWQSLPSV